MPSTTSSPATEVLRRHAPARTYSSKAIRELLRRRGIQGTLAGFLTDYFRPARSFRARQGSPNGTEATPIKADLTATYREQSLTARFLRFLRWIV
jgi:hypothetical protein